MTTTTNNTNANITDAIAGLYGQTVAALSLAAICNQLSFSLGMKLSPRDETKTTRKPAQLADYERDFYGLDNGLPVRADVDPDTIAAGFIAAQVLLVNLVRTPDPETGKRPQWAANYFRDATMIAENVTDWQAKRAIADLETRAKAFSTVGAKIDMDAAKAKIEAAKLSNRETMTEQVNQCLKRAMMEVGKISTDAAIDLALDTCDKLGLDINGRIIDSLENVVARQVERFNKNEYATIDSGVVAFMLKVRNIKPESDPTPAAA